MAQCFLHGLAPRGHLASHLALQASDDGALTFDDFEHAPELPSTSVTPSLVALQLAYFGVDLSELDAFGIAQLDHFGFGGLKQLAICWVSNGFLLHRRVHDHADQFFFADQLRRCDHLSVTG